MSHPWELYDHLIDQIPADVRVTSAVRNGQWCRVSSDEGGCGMAFNFPVESRPRQCVDEDLVGMPLRDAAALARSWNFAEAGIGMAALNAWYANPDRALASGFTPTLMNNFAHLFDPWAENSRGKRVGIIGHFPFAPRALPHVGELLVFERSLRDGDYPDSAAEYLLPTCDIVFITGSAFVNKTAPRLLELSRECPEVIVVGPSTPASTALLEAGATSVLPFVCADGSALEQGLGGSLLGGMYDAGYRVEAHRPR